MTTRDQRAELLRDAGWNLFRLRSEDVMVDLLTDSGTGAMSAAQWGALMIGDESYAGARSWFRFRDAVAELTGFPLVVPTHQGRAAERILFECLGVRDKVVASNGLFDTTRANVESQGGTGLDIPCPEASKPELEAPFKGNIDVGKLEDLLSEQGPALAAVVMTVTNNTGGGQPVSMANIRAASRLCRRHGVGFYLDACRFAENAYFVQQREPAYMEASVKSIAQEMFSMADGATFSAKKDGLANIGGFLAVSNERLHQSIEQALILTEGFPTYGGLAGRDLDAIAVGLQEVVQESYVENRVSDVRYLGEGLLAAGMPIIRPPGGHAIYVDAGSLLPHIPPRHFPGHSLACALYKEGGIRSCEIGSFMFGAPEDQTGQAKGQDQAERRLELCRLAVPRRVYGRAHLDYVVDVAADVAKGRGQLGGYEIVEAPPRLRHFSASLRPLASRAVDMKLDLDVGLGQLGGPGRCGDAKQGKEAAGVPVGK
ncbi:unnamed protein product [Ostreobium quekettii]|uniref:Aromatic amino acid beta-eliminating lyase/threonine aldolase domain-containing protein n=1 Tax=Ostreobium quekettii TaxID=121088 RepID=A0A8S1IW19_9CHLO|nr:unnamed protein product [Ostreobium quekettii]|eukprot:evm.model.scf_629EXC.10 EVM.evm.TU.scf_629EXC.10   scf_629EXC:68386-72616(-)